MPTQNTTPQTEETAFAAPVTENPLAVLKTAIQSIPWADEDPTERMAAFIMGHDPEEWDELWASLPNVKESVGERFRVHALRIRESDFEGPLGVYLICDVTNLKTGERGLLSCSSQMSIVQLVRLHVLGKLPADIEVVAKDKPTKKGFRPIHLRYLAPTNAALGDPGAVVNER